VVVEAQVIQLQGIIILVVQVGEIQEVLELEAPMEDLRVSVALAALEGLTVLSYREGQELYPVVEVDITGVVEVETEALLLLEVEEAQVL
jgi:hypothetical protein